MRRTAEAAGWLDVATPLPGDPELAVHLGSVRTQPAVASLAEPHRERITRWWRQGVQGTTIHGALVRSHGFTGSYSSVRRFLAGIEAAHPQVTTVLEFDPGEAAQVDFGKGPEVLDPRTGELLGTWIFIMTLAWSRRAYAEVVTDQKVATWLGCHRRAFEWFNGVPGRLTIDNPTFPSARFSPGSGRWRCGCPSPAAARVRQSRSALRWCRRTFGAARASMRRFRGCTCTECPPARCARPSPRWWANRALAGCRRTWSVGSSAAEEYRQWCRRRLDDDWVYLWADGIYSALRGDHERLCVLVVIGVNARGEKHFLAIEDGVRESTQSWREVLLGMKQRGFTRPAKLAVGDGALGFWAALSEVFPTTRTQRCWMHKTGNVLNYLPKSGQAKAKQGLHEIWMAETRAMAERAFDEWLERYHDKYPKATACLARDRDELLAFYDFPAAHWTHLRTTNVIESAFATIRHRSSRAKGCVTRQTMLSMIYKMGRCAEKSWRRLRGFRQLAKVIEGVQFNDGIELIEDSRAAA